MNWRFGIELFAVYSLCGFVCYVRALQAHEVKRRLDDIVLTVLLWPIFLIWGWCDPFSPRYLSLWSKLEQRKRTRRLANLPRCSRIIECQTALRNSHHKGTFRFKAIDCAALLAAKLKQAPDGWRAYDEELLDWLSKRDDTDNRILPAPDFWWASYGWLIPRLVSEGKADVYCVECGDNCMIAITDRNTSGGVDKIITSDALLCPKGHVLFRTEIKRVYLGAPVPDSDDQPPTGRIA